MLLVILFFMHVRHSTQLTKIVVVAAFFWFLIFIGLTLSDFRTLPLEACQDVFVPVVRLAGEAGWVRWGNVATDGTKRQGHASRHKAMS